MLRRSRMSQNGQFESVGPTRANLRKPAIRARITLLCATHQRAFGIGDHNGGSKVRLDPIPRVIVVCSATESPHPHALALTAESQGQAPWRS